MTLHVDSVVATQVNSNVRSLGMNFLGGARCRWAAYLNQANDKVVALVQRG